MAIFEVEANGKMYEVDAPSMDAALAALRISPQPGYAEDTVRGGVSGLLSGAAGVLGIGGDISKGFGAGIEKLEKSGVNVDRKAALDTMPNWLRQFHEKQSKPIGSAEIRGAIDNAAGAPLANYDPKTQPGKYTKNVTEMVPTALGPGGPVRNLINFALIPGVASEAAGQLSKEYAPAAEPYVRAGTAMTTGLGAALLNRPRAPEQAIRGAIPENVNPALFDQAQRMVDDAAAQGIRLTVPEAMQQIQPGSATGMLNQMRLLESAPGSRAEMAQVFAERPQQIEGAARQTFDTVGQRVADPSMIGPVAGEASEGILGQVRAAINTATRPSYDAARQSLVPQNVHAAMMADPLFAETLNAVRNDPARNSFIRAQSDRSVVVYDAVKQELQERARNATSLANPNRSNTVAAATGTMADDVRRVAVTSDRAAMGLQPGQGVGNLEQALAEQAQLRQQYLEPLQRGPLGRMAGKDTTTRNAVEALFGSESKVAGSEHEIATAVGALAQRNPRVANDLVRAHAEMTFDLAARPVQTGPNQYSGANFAKEFSGQDRANLEAAVRALPNGGQIWTGFERFLEIAEATGARQRPGSLTAFNAQDLQQMSQGRLTSEVAKATVSPIRAVSKLGDMWDTWQLGRNLGQIAQILTDPRGANYLRAIAARPTGSNEAMAVAARLAGAGWIAGSDTSK